MESINYSEFDRIHKDLNQDETFNACNVKFDIRSFIARGGINAVFN